MTNWSDVEFFAAPLKGRKAKEFLPFITNALTCWDFMACTLSGKAALGLYARFVIGRPLDFTASGPFLRDIVFGGLIAALILRAPESELNPRLSSVNHIAVAGAGRSMLAFGVLVVVGLATRATDDLARLWLVSWLAIFAVIVVATRFAVGHYLHYLRQRGGLREAIAIIGAPGARERMAARLADEADVVGLLGPQMSTASAGPHGDELSQLLDLGRHGGLDSVILAMGQEKSEEWAHIIERLKILPVQVAVCPEDGWSAQASSQMRMLGGLPMAVVADQPIKRWDLFVKAVLDKVGALLLLVLLAPLLLAIGMAVAATSPGPVIFRQQRRGWCGKDFTIFKFRTMRGGTASGQTRRHDPRCTPLGRFLRSCSLDELPQLWNVLRGDMSLVGPRPHAEALHDLDRAGREIVAEYAQRHRVKPGLTGWAQVNGARGATRSLAQLRRRVDYDLYYIENWSLLLDLRILLYTPLSMTGESVF